MPSDDPISPPPGPPAEAPSSDPSPPVADATAPGPSGAARGWALAAGTAAALASWLLIEATLETFKPKGTARPFVGSTFLFAGWEERAAAVARNAALALGLTGAAVGLALGLAGGLARRSARAGVAAGSIGLVVCAASGAAAALASVPLASHVRERDPGNMAAEMASSLLVHGLPWAAVGAVGGLAFGFGFGGRTRALRGLLGGLLGAVAGAFLFEMVGALALPASKTVEPVAASWGIRLLAQCLAAIPTAAGVAALVSRTPDAGLNTSRS